jgi:hypothetical protein
MKKKFTHSVPFRLPVIFLSLFVRLSQPTHAQAIFSPGQLSLKDGTTRSGQLAIKRVNKTQRVILLDQSGKSSYTPGDVTAIRIGDEHFVSRNISVRDSSNVLLRQLVSGYVSLYQYERKGGANLLLAEKDQTLTTLNATSPGTTLTTLLTDCPSLPSQTTRLQGNTSRRELSRYVIQYNQCVKPDMPTASLLSASRSVSVAVSPRVFLASGSFQFRESDGSMSDASTIWSTLGYGADINVSWRNRLSAGFTMALLRQEGRWNLDQTAKLFLLIDKINEQTLFLNPNLRYSFARTSQQKIVPYVQAGFVFNKLLSGEMVQSNRVYSNPKTLTINQEVGFDELGWSAGLGVNWQITSRLSAVTDYRLAYTKSLGGYTVEKLPGEYSIFRPINSSILGSLGVSYTF